MLCFFSSLYIFHICWCHISLNAQVNYQICLGVVSRLEKRTMWFVNLFWNIGRNISRSRYIGEGVEVNLIQFFLSFELKYLTSKIRLYINWKLDQKVVFGVKNWRFQVKKNKLSLNGNLLYFTKWQLFSYFLGIYFLFKVLISLY